MAESVLNSAHEECSPMAACGQGSGPCIVALRAHVARLEGEVAAKDAALRGLDLEDWPPRDDDGDCWFCAGRFIRGKGQQHTEDCALVVAIAALSDAGEGWVSPEVREKVNNYLCRIKEHDICDVCKADVEAVRARGGDTADLTFEHSGSACDTALACAALAVLEVT